MSRKHRPCCRTETLQFECTMPVKSHKPNRSEMWPRKNLGRQSALRFREITKGVVNTQDNKLDLLGVTCMSYTQVEDCKRIISIMWIS